MKETTARAYCEHDIRTLPSNHAFGEKDQLKVCVSLHCPSSSLLTYFSSVSELKLTSDEALPQVLESLGYEQSFTFSDIKLALGYVTVAIAALLFYIDKKFSFNETYYVVAGLIALYGLVSLVMYYLNSHPNLKNTTYVGYNKSNQKITVHTWCTKYDPIYNVKIVLDDKRDGANSGALAFNKFFDEFGYLNRQEFSSLVSGLVEKKEQ